MSQSSIKILWVSTMFHYVETEPTLDCTKYPFYQIAAVQTFEVIL